MTYAAIVGSALYIALFVGYRTLSLWARTGRIPLASLSDPHRSRASKRAEAWIALGLLTWGVGLGLWAVDPGYWLTHPHLGDHRALLEPLAAGLLLVAAAVLTAGNLSMGDSWCMGIRETPQPLVQEGLFRAVRHPIYTAMIAYFLAAALLVPTAWMVPVMAMAITAQTLEAALEEDYWMQREPEAYAELLRRTDGFLPGKALLRWILGRS